MQLTVQGSLRRLGSPAQAVSRHHVCVTLSRRVVCRLSVLLTPFRSSPGARGSFSRLSEASWWLYQPVFPFHPPAALSPHSLPNSHNSTCMAIASYYPSHCTLISVLADFLTCFSGTSQAGYALSAGRERTLAKFLGDAVVMVVVAALASE